MITEEVLNALLKKEIMLKNKYLLCEINAFSSLGYEYIDNPTCMYL